MISLDTSRSYYFLVCQLVVLLFSLKAISQTNYKIISGKVSDSETGEKLINASIYTIDHNTFAFTNEFGVYIINIPDTTEVLISHYLGYKSDTIRIKEYQDFHLQVSNNIDDVVIKASRIQRRQDQPGIISMPMSLSDQLPQLFGSNDVMRSLTMFPGVSSGIEGMTGLFVRGGGPGQNLILLDGNKIYNNAHLLGISSAINPMVVNSVDLYKGGFPAQYGTRTSSVIRINTKDGNSTKKKTHLSFGVLESNIATEGPIKSLNATYIIAARATYLGLITLPRYLGYQWGLIDNYYQYYFYDINGKIKFKLSEKQNLSIGYFRGDDTYKYAENFNNENYFARINWGNELSNIRYSFQPNSNHFLSIDLVRNRYHFKLRNGYFDEIYDVDVLNNSKNQEYALNLNASITFNKTLDLKYGAGVTHTRFNPFNIELLAIQPPDTTQLDKSFQYTFNQAHVYLETDVNLFKNMSVILANRLDIYDLSKQKVYNSPRIKLLLSKANKKYYLAFDRMNQFEHLLYGSNGGLPNEIFVPSINGLDPQISNQISLGSYNDFPKTNFSINIEAFYKRYDNQNLYIQNYFKLFSPNLSWQDNLISNGDGYSYGVEIYARKEVLRHNFTLSYTYLDSRRLFHGFNNDDSFPATFVRRHDLMLTYVWDINSSLSLSSNFVIASGYYITLPNSSYRSVNGELLPIVSAWNNVRTRLYNRMDVGGNYKYLKGTREITWKFGIYNIYGYRNPMFYNHQSYSIIDIQNRAAGVQGRVSRINGFSSFNFMPYVSYSTSF